VARPCDSGTGWSYSGRRGTCYVLRVYELRVVCVVVLVDCRTGHRVRVSVCR